MPKKSNAKAKRLLNIQKANQARLATVNDMSTSSRDVEMQGEGDHLGADDHVEVDHLGDCMVIKQADEIVMRFIIMEEEGKGPSWESEADNELDEMEERIINEKSLDEFTHKLQDAHNAWLAEQKANKAQKPKRRQWYTRNSKQSQERQSANRCKLATKGQKFIGDLFTPKTISSEVILDDSTSESETEEVVVRIGDKSEMVCEDGSVQDCNTDTDFNIDSKNSPAPLSHLIASSPTPSPTMPSLPNRILSMLVLGEEIADLHVQAEHAASILAATKSEKVLNTLTWKETQALKKALTGLTKKAKDKKIDVFFHAHITAMVATLNFYLDEKLPCTWTKASMLTAKAVGQGENHARNL